MRCLLDTDVTSEILKGKHSQVLQNAGLYLSQYGRFAISLMTRYEILRGLKAKRAPKQLADFETWCQVHDLLPIDEDVIALAADLYAGLKRKGQPIGDNDLIIAATALHNQLVLATRNVAHFSRLPGLTVEDWSKP